MFRLLLILGLAIFANANSLTVQNGQIKAHTEVFGDSEINPTTKNVKDLSDKLKEIITKDYEVMKNASKEIIFNNLSAEIMSKNYQKIYERLLGLNK